MKRLLLVLCLLACAEPLKPVLDPPAGPPVTQLQDFSVRVRVRTRPALGGCHVDWDAIPSYRLSTINYRVGTLKPSNADAARLHVVSGGTFMDSTRKSWNQAIDLTFGVYWEVSVGFWSDSGRVSVTNCPTS